ncbi:hypothetical protein BH10PSE12_BH10PSE12_07510 [soil metagenome]
MRSLAQTAEVGPMATYKLFGSKHELLNALSELDVEKFKQRLAHFPTDRPLDDVFDVLDVAKALYTEETVFYKGLFKAAFDSQNPSMADVFSSSRVALWRIMLDDCVAAGCLDKTINTSAMARNILYIYGGSIQRWVRDEVDLNRLYAEVRFGLASALMSFVTEAERELMRARFDAAAKALADS